MVDMDFIVSIDDITEISAQVNWAVPENNNNVQFRLQIREEGLCVCVCS